MLHRTQRSDLRKVKVLSGCLLRSLARGTREGRTSTGSSLHTGYPGVHHLGIQGRGGDRTPDTLDDIIEMYLLGDVFDDVKLRNETLRMLVRNVKTSARFPNPEQCHVVWEHTSSYSSIRKCIVDCLVSLLAPDELQKHAAEFPTDLVLQVAMVLMRRYAETEAVNVKALEKRLETYTEREDDV